MRAPARVSANVAHERLELIVLDRPLSLPSRQPLVDRLTHGAPLLPGALRGRGPALQPAVPGLRPEAGAGPPAKLDALFARVERPCGHCDGQGALDSPRGELLCGHCYGTRRVGAPRPDSVRADATAGALDWCPDCAQHADLSHLGHCAATVHSSLEMDLRRTKAQCESGATLDDLAAWKQRREMDIEERRRLR